ncbi:hypothetical protein RRG08_032483, partial [Elysia crispata]
MEGEPAHVLTAVATAAENTQTSDSSWKIKTYSLIQQQIEDSIYQEMRCHFFMTGKGRRPKLPNINLTNQLLLQLYGLKEEKGATWMEMTKWFQQLLPSQPVTMGKLEHRIEKLLTSVYHLFQEGRDAELPHCLDTALDFDQLPHPLACLGLTRTVLLANPSNYTQR